MYKMHVACFLGLVVGDVEEIGLRVDTVLGLCNANTHTHTLTLCAVFEQGLSHFKPQRAALSWRLPCNLQAFCRSPSVKYDGVDHRQVISKIN